MRRLTIWDWLGGTAVWSAVSFGVAVMLDSARAPEEVTVMVGMGVFLGGLVGARIWALRRPVEEPGTPVRNGLTTGEMTAQRLAEMEARVYELEERLELAERLLAAGGQRVPMDRLNA